MRKKTNRRNFIKCSGAILGGIAVGTTVVAAERTDRFIVQTRDDAGLGGLDVVHEMPGVDFAVVRGSESDVNQARGVKDYAPDIEVELDDPEVNEVAPTVDETSVADEPLYPFQWDKQALDIPTAHETTKGEGTRVTVIDSGVLETHPDLAGPLNVSLSKNFTDDGQDHNPVGSDHGTHVAGIIAADDTNDRGTVGTAPETDLVNCRVFSGPFASFADILAAIVYSVNVNADAANLSLGAYPVPRQGLGSFYGKVLNRVMTLANEEGTLLCIAAGNDSADLQHDKNFISLPNEGAQGLSISATGPVGFMWDPSIVGDEEAPPESPAFYTNYGTNAIDIGAPGGDVAPTVVEELFDGDEEPLPAGWFLDLVFNATFEVVETDDDGFATKYRPTWSWKAGTSMAAPQVAGAAALVKSANPNYNANQVEAALERAADVPDDYDKTFYGSGFLNVVDAL